MVSHSRDIMISDFYNLKEFVERVKDRDWSEIVDLTVKEIREANRRSAFVKGAAKARAQGSIEYGEKLKAFLAFMRTQAVPCGIDEVDFELFRPVAENMVRKGEFKSQVMSLFRSK